MSKIFLFLVLEPHQPLTTIKERLSELTPKNFSEFPPPPANQLWSFKIKPSTLKQSQTLEFSQGNKTDSKIDLPFSGGLLETSEEG